MPVHQDARDLTKIGSYMVAVVVLVSSFAMAGMAALSPESPLLGWAATALEPSEKHVTRLDQAVANAREIRAALAKPIPRPEPLPPITAKLAYGHLKPGGTGAVAERKLPSASMNAMAMDVSSSYRASSATIPEMHKVY